MGRRPTLYQHGVRRMVFALVKKQLKKKANCLYSIFKYCEETLWDFFGGCSEIISNRYSEKTIAPEGDLC